MPVGRGRYNYPQEIKNLVIHFLEKGFSCREVAERVYAANYDPPTKATMMKWWRDVHPNEIKGSRAQKKGVLYHFNATKRVAAWLNKQSNKTLAINTIIEWYLREMQLEKRRVRERERYKNRFKKEKE